MELLLVVMSGFAFALLIPGLHRWMGDTVKYLATLCPLGIALYAVGQFAAIGAGETIVESYAWASELGLTLALRMDGLALLFVLLISVIGALVMLYTGGYLAGHPRLGRFYTYILSFMAAMVGLVLAANVLTLYVFWELTTLTSFALIGFEHEKSTARSAAVQALLVTAQGGLAMLAGLVLLGIAGGSFEFATLAARSERIQGHAFYPAIVVLILLGAFTKSAQFPFQFWLPNAMAAPTPVSAYLHSATMVKAGIYLVARLTPTLGGSDLWFYTVTSVGMLTMIIGAYLALFQFDLKAILAYLTVNVLGTLMMLLGLGTPESIKAAITYLLAHACYKGALFLTAGIIDHEVHSRDVRELGGLYRRMPVTMTAGLLATLSMVGFIPLLGFIGKEKYLEAVWHAEPGKWILAPMSVLASIFLVAGAGLILRPFFARATSSTEAAHEPGFQLWFGPLLLAVYGLAAGLFPRYTGATIVGPAASAILRKESSVDLSLWHGVTIPFVLSITALVVGACLYAVREPARRFLIFPLKRIATGPSAMYEHLLVLLNTFARWQTDMLQSGYLRIYVLCVVLAFAGAIGATALQMEIPVHRSELGVYFHEAVASILILLAAFVAVRTNSRLHAIAAMGVVGYSVAWLFSLFSAPDLALTQIVVESLTVILFVLAFYTLPRYSLLSSYKVHIRDATVAIATGGLVTAILLLVTSFQAHDPISPYFGEHSLEEAHGRNVVNVILVDFRAFDTLGEITVLSIAAIGVHSLLKMRRKESA